MPRISRRRIYWHHSRIATTFQVGPVFLAGDAAHLQPPFFGQGMNSGIRDATNLGWKLAAVLAGRADERLLDTYDAERRAHAETMVSFATRVGAMYEAAQPVHRTGARRVLRRRPAHPWGPGLHPADEVQAVASLHRGRGPGPGRPGQGFPGGPDVRPTVGGDRRPAADEARRRHRAVLRRPRHRARPGGRAVRGGPGVLAGPGRADHPGGPGPHRAARRGAPAEDSAAAATPAAGAASALTDPRTGSLLVRDIDGAFRDLRLGRPADEIIILRPDRYVLAVCPAAELEATTRRLRALLGVPVPVPPAATSGDSTGPVAPPTTSPRF